MLPDLIERGRPAASWIGQGYVGNMNLVVIALGITGELLPWTEQAVHATEVRTSLLGEAPVLGETMRDAVLGSDVVAGPAGVLAGDPAA